MLSCATFKCTYLIKNKLIFLAFLQNPQKLLRSDVLEQLRVWYYDVTVLSVTQHDAPPLQVAQKVFVYRGIPRKKLRHQSV